MIEADLKIAMRELTAAQADDTTPAPVKPVLPQPILKKKTNRKGKKL